MEDVAFFPDGEKLVAGGGRYSADNIAVVYSVSGQNEIAALEGHTLIVQCVAVSPRGTLIATGGVDREVRLWSAENYTEVANLGKQAYHVSSLAFSPDAEFLVTATRGSVEEPAEIAIWHLGTKKVVKRITGLPWVTDVAISHDGKWMAVAATDPRIRLWRLDRLVKGNP